MGEWEKGREGEDRQKVHHGAVTSGDPWETAECGQPGARGCGIYPPIPTHPGHFWGWGVEQVSVKCRERQTLGIRHHRTRGIAP